VSEVNPPQDAPPLTVVTVGQLLRERRMALGITDQECAKRLGTHYTYWLKLVCGDRHLGVEMAFRVAEILGGTPEQWLTLKVRQDCAEYRARGGTKRRKGKKPDDQS
jgi:plasmid maintenance system antidote protein VapI